MEIQRTRYSDSELPPLPPSKPPTPDNKGTLKTSISGPVGKGGWNLPADVAVVQKMLNQARVGGPTSKLRVTGTLDPATQQAITGFQSTFFQTAFWTAGWIDGRIDPGGPTLSMLRMSALNTETPISNFSLRVPGIIQPIRQFGPTCWAAAAVTMLSWRKQNRSLDVREEISRIGKEWLDLYDTPAGLDWNRHEQFARAAKMNHKPPASFGVDTFRRILLRPSPVWVAFTMSSGASHAVTIVGMQGDGTSIGTTVDYHDTATGWGDRIPFVLLAVWMAKTEMQFTDQHPIATFPNSQLFFF